MPNNKANNITNVNKHKKTKLKAEVCKARPCLTFFCFVISLFLSVIVNNVLASPQSIDSTPNKLGKKELTNDKLSALHQCEKKFEYDVYFLDKNVGHMHRAETWNNNAVTTIKNPNEQTPISAVVKSSSEVHFLFLSSTYQQQSNLQFSYDKNYFLTSSFSQKLTGLREREMEARISSDGLSSVVTLDEEVSHYKNDTPLYDLDTLGAQMRFNLLQEKSEFNLYRQGSDEIKEYLFEVIGMEVIKHQQWGELSTIKVIEVGEHKGTVLWFSIKHDYQLVKAQLDLIFSPIVWLTHFEVNC